MADRIMDEIPGSEVEKGSADAFRRVWRGFGSTVALVATESEGRRYGMLATAVTSVSMEPPSLLVCLNRSASAHAPISRRQAFSIGLLPSSAHDLGDHIARSQGADRFARGHWETLSMPGEAIHGLPWLLDAQSTLFCCVDNHHDYGTHTIFIAKIHSVHETGTSNPLLYCEGHYGLFEKLAKLAH